MLLMPANTVRGVVCGMLRTALVQAVMTGIGLVIAGVLGAALLALLSFFRSVVPMGPPLQHAIAQPLQPRPVLHAGNRFCRKTS